MASAACWMSQRNHLGSRRIDLLSGFVDGFSEVWVFDRGVVDEVDFAVEEGLEVFFEVDVIAVPGFPRCVAKFDDEVDVALVRFEVADCGGAEDVESLDVVASADLGDLVGMFCD